MNVRPFQGFLMILLAGVCWSVSGCTRPYEVCVRLRETGEPLVEASVTIQTASRIYSFLDPRHYFGESGKKAFVASGITDAYGRAVVRVPRDLGIECVRVRESWFAQEPSGEWQPMLSWEEFYRSTSPHSEEISYLQGRPEVKIAPK